MKTPRIGLVEATARGWLVAGRDVLDVRRFAVRHPGGDHLTALVGSDATFALLNAHGVRGELSTKLKALRKAEFDNTGLDPADADLRDLWARYQAEGMFRPPLAAVAWFAVRLALFYVGGFALAERWPAIGVGLLCLGHLDVIWWVHDIAHNSVCTTARAARLWTDVLAVLFLGTPAVEYHYRTHRLHHVYTNVLGLDEALDTGPIIWDPRQEKREQPSSRRWQPVVWFGLVLPSIFPLFLLQQVVSTVTAKRYCVLTFCMVRWIAAGMLSDWSPWVLLFPAMAGGYWLALLSSLNHFHLPLEDALTRGFVRSVALHTQNFTHRSRLATWLTGGLNFHIEHHLFATMPRHRYSEVSDDVRALFRQHGLPYRSAPLGRCLVRLWRTLRQERGPRGGGRG